MKKILFAMLVLTAALTLSACAASPSAQSTPLPTSQMETTLIAEGTLLPVNTLDQAFSVRGQIAEVLVKDGETVKKGQALAKLNASPEANLALSRAEQEVLAAQQALDNLSPQADLNLAKAQLAVIAAQSAFDDAQEAFDAEDTEENKAMLDKATAELKLAQDAKEKLATGAGIDPDLLAAAKARLQSAKDALISAQSAVDALTLTASTSGTVVDLAVQPGQWVTAGVPVITLADFSEWVVKTDNLTEMNVASISLGQTVEVIFDALPEKTLKGQVTHINTRYEEKRGDVTYTVTITLLDTDPSMRWGMTAAVKFAR